MTFAEAKKLRVGDKVIIKTIGRISEIADIREKTYCSGLHNYIVIKDIQGGLWTHKEINKYIDKT